MKLFCLSFLIVFGALTVNAQWYNVTFRGVCYTQDGSGNLAGAPMTEQTLIEAAAQARSIPTNNLALVYHVEEGGDSIKVVNKTTGEQYVRYFMFLFGTTLGRTAAANATGTEIRGVEYIYTTDGTRYTSWNDHSMGAVVLHKRILTDGNGTTRHSVDGQHMQWCVLPQGNESAKTCSGSFQTGTLFSLGN